MPVTAQRFHDRAHRQPAERVHASAGRDDVLESRAARGLNRSLEPLERSGARERGDTYPGGV
jgi:hypothetical protein